LKKQYGIEPTKKGKQSATNAVPHSNSVIEHTSSSGGPAMRKAISTTDKIDQIKINREQRRQKMDEARKTKAEREANNDAMGIKCDVDF